MATQHSTTTFTGWLKQKYAKRVVSTVPNSLLGQKDFAYKADKVIGAAYNQPVVVTFDQGMAYSAAGTAVTYATVVTGLIANAQVNGSQGAMKTEIDYETLSKAVKEGDTAYGNAGRKLIEMLVFSTRKRLECEIWHGQRPLAIVQASGKYSNGTQYIDITDATWAPHIWCGQEGASIEVFPVGRATQRGSAATISSVDMVNKRLELSGDVPASTAATDEIWFTGTLTEGATPAYKGMLGLCTAAKTSTGNVWGLSTNYSTWAPYQHSASSGALTFAKVQDVMAIGAAKGLEDDAVLYTNFQSWADLMGEQAGYRRYGGDFAGRSRFVNGASAIEFWASTGRLLIKPCGYIHEGESLLLPVNSTYRIGSVDVTLGVPGFEDVPLATRSQTSTAINLNSYYSQAVFCEKLSQAILVQHIVNS